MEYHIAIKHFHFKENSVWKNLVLREKKWLLNVHASFFQFLQKCIFVHTEKNTGNVTNMPKSNGNKPNFDFHYL